jgi:hypothetical protein
MPVITGAQEPSQIIQKISKQHTMKLRCQGTTEKKPYLAHALTSESTNVQVQKFVT